MRQTLLLEINMSKVFSPQNDFSDYYFSKSLRDLSEMAPDIPWVEYINRILPDPIKVNETEKIYLFNANYISNISKVMEQTPKRVVANFIIWKLVMETAVYLSEDIRDSHFEFLKHFTGPISPRARFEFCVDLVAKNLVFAVDNLYVKNYFDESTKAQIEELVADIRSTFNTVLTRLDWLDEVTRKEVLDRSEAAEVYVAYTEGLLDDENLTNYYSKLQVRGNGSLLQNKLNISVFNFNNIASRLREGINQTSWQERFSTIGVNAFYHPLQNCLEFPAAILQGYFFQLNRSKFMNYGAIGQLIGHEITHEFTDIFFRPQQRNFYGWWWPEARKSFLRRVQCSIEQYDNFDSPETGLKLNGTITREENIADIGGVALAYKAYHNWFKRNGKEDQLPGLEDYSSHQLFWISTAQLWCSKRRTELEFTSLNEEHSKKRFRVIGSLSNSLAFAYDFKCPLGSKMNPLEKCLVW